MGKELRARTRSYRAQSGGFTLIELAIVVVIVGVLAVLGVVGYSRYRAHVRMNEATSMITSIRAAQEQYKTEAGVYANVSKTAESYYPAETPGQKLTQWGAPCTSACNDPNAWKRLAVQPNGPVMFGYATVAAVGGGAPISKPSEAALSAPVTSLESSVIQPTDPYFIAVANGDYDGNGVACSVMGLSHTKELIITNDGE